MLVRFSNCTLLRDGEFVVDDLWVKDGIIINPQEWFYTHRTKADTVVDCKGGILAPGYIDVQINGAFGVDFSSADSSSFDSEEYLKGVTKVAKGITQHGCTAFCPTVITSEPAVYKAVLPFLGAKKGGSDEGAALLGAHLEGPFINAQKKGAHPIQHIRPFAEGAGDRAVRHSLPHLGSVESEEAPTSPLRALSSNRSSFSGQSGNVDNGGGSGRVTTAWEDAAEAALAECYGALDNIAFVTLAPELDAAPEAIKYLKAKGVKVSVGHSAADLSAGEKAHFCGATMITHLFNAMAAFHHRDPGLIGLISSAAVAAGPEKLYYGLIVDGIHTCDAALRMAHSTDPAGCILVTDAMAAMGLPAGEHKLGVMSVIVDHNYKVVLAGTNTLAGSAARMDRCVQRFAAVAGKVLALECASLHPALFLGLANKGRLQFGCDADLVLLDHDLEVQRTFIGGQECATD